MAEHTEIKLNEYNWKNKIIKISRGKKFIKSNCGPCVFYFESDFPGSLNTAAADRRPERKREGKWIRRLKWRANGLGGCAEIFKRHGVAAWHNKGIPANGGTRLNNKAKGSSWAEGFHFAAVLPRLTWAAQQRFHNGSVSAGRSVWPTTSPDSKKGSKNDKTWWLLLINSHSTPFFDYDPITYGVEVAQSATLFVV